jgi:3-methyladenine DNA glycosylase Tag
MERATMNHRILWSNIEACLDLGPVRWRERIEELGQVRAVKDRSAGRIWSDDEIFRGVLLAVLSSNTVWSKVERIQADLSELFCDFSLEAYASHSDTEIDSRFVPWFKDRKAGSVPLRGGLVNLIRAARILLQYSKCHGAADGYFTSLVHQGAGDPKQAALRLGGQSQYKLPSLGVALAAEALKNLGFDVAKPDRHMMRAVGSFGLVRFNRWKLAQGGRGHPESTSRTKLLEVMTVAEQIAEAAEESVVFVDNAIWLLCAKDELYLTNSELAAIAHQVEPPNDGSSPVPAQGP